MTSIYGRLGFDAAAAGDNVQPLGESTVKYMANVPPLLNDWQKTDLANSDVGGYFQNPVGTVSANIWTTSNNIVSITGLSSSNASAIYTAAQGLQSAANNFFGHTNRMSGVEPINPDTALLPHYDSAIGIGKIIMYLVHQSDGISNNSPLIGSFTSLFTGNTLNTYYTTIQNYPTTITNSLTSSTDMSDPPVTTYSCNLSPTQITTISTNLSAITTFMNNKRTADVNFYTNSQAVVADYNAVKGFNNMGQTQEDILNNHIGTTKLLNRLNS